MKIPLKKIEKIAKGRFKSALSCHDWDHVQRVYNLALLIGKKEKADLDIIRVAALLHDIKRDDEKWGDRNFCHAREGAKATETILKNLNLPANFISAVKHCVAAHRFRSDNKPTSLEAKILYDADKLDTLGAIGVGRCFIWTGQHGLRLHNTDPKVIRRNNPYSHEHSFYSEYMVKLRFLKDKMFTQAGQAIARERTVFMSNFLTRLDEEVKGKL